MKIHIPKHFENLGVMKILKDIIDAYAVEAPEFEDNFNFSEYNKSASIDPVRRFLEFIYESDENSDKDNNILTYYTNLLYSLRGSMKIFDVLAEMETILGLKIGYYTYSTKELIINIGSVNTIDLNLFNNYLSAFFGSLLYYEDIQAIIEEATLDLKVDLDTSFNCNASFVSEYVVKEEVIEYEN